MRRATSARGRRKGVPALLFAIALAAPAVAAQPPPEPAEILRDDDYRLRLLRPGPSWVLLDEAASGAQVPGSLLGALEAKGTFAVVSVVPAPPADLEAFARLSAQRVAHPDLKIDSLKPRRYLGEDAVRLHLSLSVGGVTVVEEDTLFLREGYLYVVTARATADLARATSGPYAFLSGLALFPGQKPAPPTDEQVERLFLPFHESLEILPGPVHPRPAPPSRGVEARGPGWRIKDGVFESAVSGLKATPPPGWAFLRAEDLSNVLLFAEVGLLHARTGTVVALMDEPAAGLSAAEYDALVVRQLKEQLREEPAASPRDARFLGETVAFERFDLAAPFPREAAFATRTTPRRAFQVHVYAAVSKLEEAWAAIPGALAAFEELPAEREAALAKELSALPDPQGTVAPGTSVRDGTWRDHALGASWRKPSALWRLFLPREVPGLSDTLLFAEGRERGIAVRLMRLPPQGVVFDSADDAARHAMLSRALLGEAAAGKAPVPARLGGLDAERTTASVSPFPGLRQRQDLVTARWKGQTVALFSSAPEVGDSAGLDAALEEATAALGLEPESAPARTPGLARVEDPRMGFAFAMPLPGWGVRDETPKALASVGSIVHALGPGQHAYVVAISAERMPEASTPGFLDLALASVLGARYAGVEAGESAADVLAGLPAVRRRWSAGGEAADIVVARRGTLLYCLVLSARHDKAGITLDDAKARFEILP